MFTFSDPTVIRRLQTEFIPVSGNSAEWQDGNSPTQRWFMSVAKQTDYLKAQPGGRTQGLYTLSADGTAFGWLNTHDPTSVNKFLDAAREKFRARKAVAVKIADEERKSRFAETPGATTSVIRVFTRVPPLPENANAPSSPSEYSSIVHQLNTKSMGRDHLWVYAEEVREILAGGERSKGDFALPATLAGRIVRYHLHDNVRGTADMWEPAQVRRADFTVREISRAKGARVFSLRGTFAMQLDTGARGQEGWLQGEFTIDPGAAKITRFRAYSEGKAWGRSKHTLEEPAGRFPLVIAMVETNDAVSRIVPPHFIWMGNQYRQPGVVFSSPPPKP